MGSSPPPPPHLWFSLQPYMLSHTGFELNEVELAFVFHNFCSCVWWMYVYASFFPSAWAASVVAIKQVVCTPLMRRELVFKPTVVFLEAERVLIECLRLFLIWFGFFTLFVLTKDSECPDKVWTAVVVLTSPCVVLTVNVIKGTWLNIKGVGLLQPFASKCSWSSFQCFFFCPVDGDIKLSFILVAASGNVSWGVGLEIILCCEFRTDRSSLNAGCSTTANQWRPSQTKLMMNLSNLSNCCLGVSSNSTAAHHSRSLCLRLLGIFSTRSVFAACFDGCFLCEPNIYIYIYIYIHSYPHPQHLVHWLHSGG